jgi:putative MATE family efflux protein
VLFALPLALAALLQQSYNAFDSIVVGRFVSNEALAAVGSSGPLTMMIVAFFMGMSNGSSVLISQFFGARNTAELKNTVHTAILLSILIGFGLSAVGVTVAPLLLRVIQTPDEVFVEAVVYLRIYFIGLPGLTVYNMGAAVLTATGDSKRPLYFLMLSMVIKVALNLLFVLVFNMGVAAVAWSTVIAQVINAVLVIWLLCNHPSDIKLNLKQLRIHRHIMSRILKLGLPGGIQGSIVSFSNVIVQTYINRLGGMVMAGYGASQRIDAFVMIPVQSMALGVSTFVGQNLGARKVKRARGGVRTALAASVGSVLFLSAAVYIFAPGLIRIFTIDDEVIAHGLTFVRIFVPFYFLLCLVQVTASALRGSGNVKIPTIISISCFVILRQIYLFVVTQFTHTVASVALGFPLGWFISSVLLLIYYKRSNWDKFESP